MNFTRQTGKNGNERITGYSGPLRITHLVNAHGLYVAVDDVTDENPIVIFKSSEVNEETLARADEQFRSFTNVSIAEARKVASLV